MLLTKTPQKSQYSYLTFVYFNGETTNLKFRFAKIIRLVDLKFTLDNLLWYPNYRRVVKLHYCLPSIDNEKDIYFNKFELKMDEDLTVIWNTFHRYKIKSPNKIDVTAAARSTDNILNIEISSTIS